MTYLQVEQALIGHRKVHQLARLLKRSVASTIGYLVAMWLWSFDNCDATGALSTGDGWLLESAALWQGRRGVLVAALVEAGFLERDGDLLRIHGWAEHEGKVLAEREAAREKKRVQRARGREGSRLSSRCPWGRGRGRAGGRA